MTEILDSRIEIKTMKKDGKLANKHALGSAASDAWQAEMDTLHKWNTYCAWAHLV